ncbi:MAG TPA: galactose-1-phosphate uridylyltransferase [Xanthobacteraceae bacterium]|jgi:UDPglucose--hexose-1-phosphate uridylyltransferase
MSELRRDPTTDRWVIIAPERSRRPREIQPQSKKPSAEASAFDPTCPFCPGNEAQLPGLIAEMPSTQQPGWRTRVVPNKFPAVGQKVFFHQQGPAFYETAAGRGNHEVVIESPRHDHDITTMPQQQARDALATCRNRYKALTSDRTIGSVIVFRNRGAIAGASLPHPHAQLIALGTIAPLVQARQAAMLSYYQKEKRCVLCDIIAYERNNGSRVVNENDAFLTVVPFAASAPCEMWLLPKHHQADFGDLPENEVELLAIALRDALTRLRGALDDPPYDYVIDTAAKGASGAPATHWCLRIVPQVTVAAGFELGSGLPINPSLPEEDAALLRSVLQQT